MAFTPTLSTPGTAANTVGTNFLNGSSSFREFDLAAQIALPELVKNVTPLTTLLLKFAKENTTDPDFQWPEHRPSWYNQKFYSAGAVACTSSTAGTQFTDWAVSSTTGTANVGYLLPGMTIMAVDADDTTKRAYFRIDTVDSQQQIDVTLISNLPGFSVADNDAIYVMSTMFGEGSDKATDISDEPTMMWGSIGEHKNATSITNMALKTRLKYGTGFAEWERKKMEALSAHKIGLEKKFMFGQRVGVTAANPYSGPRTTTVGGLAVTDRSSISIWQACNYADTIGMGGSRLIGRTLGTYTWDMLVDDLEDVMEFGDPNRLVLAGSSVVSMFSKWAAVGTGKNVVNVTNMQSSFGWRITELVTPHGTLNVLSHSLLRGDFSNIMFGLDMGNIKLKVMEDVHWVDHTAAQTKTIQIGEWQSIMGLKIMMPETHFMFQFA